MAVERDHPYANMNFIVDLGTGISEGRRHRITRSCLSRVRFNILEYRNGLEKSNESFKALTLLHYGNLVVRRGAIGSLSWYNWWNDARNGNQAVARNIAVQLLNEDRSEVVLTWKFFRALPANYQ